MAAFPLLPILGSAIIGRGVNLGLDKAFQAGRDFLSGGLVPNGADLGLDFGEGGPTSLLAGLPSLGPQGDDSDPDSGGIPRNIQELINQGFLAYDDVDEPIGPGPRYAELVASMQADPFGGVPSLVPVSQPGGGPPVLGLPATPTVTAPRDLGVVPLPGINPATAPAGNKLTPTASFGPGSVYSPVDLGETPRASFDPFSISSPGIPTPAFGAPTAATITAGGFTPFVPETMGLAGDVSRSLFDQAALFERQAAEFDVSPVVAAGKESFAVARQNVANQREQAIGNLRANIARNRLTGSTLAQAMLASEGLTYDAKERELAVEEAKFSASAKLQELSARAGLQQQASQARTQAFSSRIDTMLKTAGIGQAQAQIQAQVGIANAQVQAQLIDSANKLKAAMSEIEAATMRTRMQIMAQEAQSIRANLTNIDIANVQATTARSVAETQAEAGVQGRREEIEFARDQGLGGLLTPIVTPAVSRIGEGIADRIFGGWTEIGGVSYRGGFPAGLGA